MEKGNQNGGQPTKINETKGSQNRAKTVQQHGQEERSAARATQNRTLQIEQLPPPIWTFTDIILRMRSWKRNSRALSHGMQEIQKGEKEYAARNQKENR